MKKILVFLILLLFISTTIVSAISIKESVNRNDVANFSGNTIYVDDDNVDGPWDGTMEHPYQHIQDGVEAANPGDTVYVFSGLYRYRQIEIHESINLIGEDKETTIFACDINGCAILIYADYVNVSGFTFTHIGYTRTMGISASHCTISDNIFSSSKPLNVIVRIYLDNAHYNTITRNEFNPVHPQFVAIRLEHSNHNVISDNIIKISVGGIIVHNGSNNTVIGNHLYCNMPLMFGMANNNKITGNHINGIVGISFDNSSGNEITYNRFGNTSKLPFRIRLYARKAVFFNSTNYWDHNYWGRPRLFPKIVFGYKEYIEDARKRIPNAFEIDWHPARTPYGIL